MLERLKSWQPIFYGLMVLMVSLAVSSRLYRLMGLARDIALYLALLTSVILGAWLFRRKG
jgi:asparagine N-glycosylation enzyme membrane subunit Stt3